jgi:hypothetical protein
MVALLDVADWAAGALEPNTAFAKLLAVFKRTPCWMQALSPGNLYEPVL